MIDFSDFSHNKASIETKLVDHKLNRHYCHVCAHLGKKKPESYINEMNVKKGNKYVE